MKVIKKQLKLKVLFGTFIVIIFSMIVFPRILLNGSGHGYTDGNGDLNRVGNTSIETYVIQGAGYFLQANSCIQSILNCVEMQDIDGIDYNEINQWTDRALENIRLSRDAYGKLIQLAVIMPYNREFIAKLKAFDYQFFMTEMGLNSVVFNQVSGYLERGDITGTFKHTSSKLVAIEDMLTAIKAEISVERIPVLSLPWKLNETCAEASLFGSYTARVFQDIR